MLKFFIRTAILLMLLNTNLLSQWEWQNPLPNGNQLNSLCYVNANKIIAVGNSSTVVASEDGGLKWSNIESESFGYEADYSNFQDVFFQDENNGWIVSSSGSIYKTEDGGINWEKKYAIISIPLFSIAFADSDTGWAVGKYGTLLKTEDGGISWEVLDFINEEDLKDITYISSQLLYVNSSAGIYKSTDGGITWVQILEVSLNYLGEQSVFFINENTGWAGSGGDILKTTDGGESWESINVKDETSIQAITFLNEETGWAVGVFGYIGVTEIFKTTDGGLTWRKVLREEQSNLLSIKFKDANNGFAAGLGGRLYQTTDGGENWTNRTSGYFSSLYTVDFVNEKQGWAGGNTTLLRTSNGGNTWEIYLFDEDIYIRGIDFISTTEGWFVGYDSLYNGVVHKTTDGGITWQDITPAQIPALNALQFLDEDTGYAVGDDGTILITKDGGENWTIQETVTKYPLGALFFLNSNTGWICGYGGQISKTIDGGASWQDTILDSGFPYFREIQFVNKDVGWISDGNWNSFWKTVDGGETWIEMYPYSTEGAFLSLKSFYFFDELNGLGGGFIFGFIYETTDGGETWDIAQDLIWNNINDIKFVDSGTGWVVGRDGAILKYSGLPVSVIESDNQLPDKFSIGQNYPNPFNPETKITYSVTVPTQVSLKIYNINGQLIKTLVSGQVPNGDHIAIWDGTNDCGKKVSSGVYIYRLHAGGFVQSKKMMLIK
ncbi:YCF48-related protein [candidate division KSB1 bacterium]